QNTYSLWQSSRETGTTIRAVEGSFLLRSASTRHLSAGQASEERSGARIVLRKFASTAAAARSPRGWEGNVRDRRDGDRAAMRPERLLVSGATASASTRRQQPAAAPSRAEPSGVEDLAPDDEMR
ncbi:hypothetical protein ALC62_12707, partial [Cyphomyrmex costatus]